MESIEETNNTENETKNKSKEKKFLMYCVEKIDVFLAEKNIPVITKRKFKETSEIYGFVYKFPHFGIEVVNDQVTIFGKYKSQFFDIEAYDSHDKLIEELLPRIEAFYHNPILTRHPYFRFLHKIKNKIMP